MISRTTARSQIETTPYQAAQAALVAWGALMLSIYMIDLLVFPLTPTLYREDQVLEPYWNFWTIMTVITTLWVFGIPLIGPLLLKWKNSRRFENSLWL